LKRISEEVERKTGLSTEEEGRPQAVNSPGFNLVASTGWGGGEKKRKEKKRGVCTIEV